MTTMRKDDAAEAWRDDPRSAIAALIDRANAEAALGRDDAALADYGRALALLPDPEKGAGTPRSGPPRGQPRALHLARGRLAEALMDFNGVVTLGLADAALHEARARARRLAGYPEAAAATARRRTRRRPATRRPTPRSPAAANGLPACHRRHRGPPGPPRPALRRGERPRAARFLLQPYACKVAAMPAKGGRQGAIADFDEARRLDPKLPASGPTVGGWPSAVTEPSHSIHHAEELNPL